MDNNAAIQGDLLHTVDSDVNISPARKALGRAALWAASALVLAVLIVELLYKNGIIGFGYDTWMPLLLACVVWSCALGFQQVMVRGEAGSRVSTGQPVQPSRLSAAPRAARRPGSAPKQSEASPRPEETGRC